MSILKELSIKMVERANALGLRGKKRDDATLDFFVGAVNALYLAGKKKDADHIATVTAMILQTRGFDEVARLAWKGEKEQADVN